jgi:hypothetical protein
MQLYLITTTHSAVAEHQHVWPACEKDDTTKTELPVISVLFTIFGLVAGWVIDSSCL